VHHSVKSWFELEILGLQILASELSQLTKLLQFK
jgi:hypothetical protein